MFMIWAKAWQSNCRNNCTHKCSINNTLVSTGKQFEGIWHTGIVVYGYEYFFGGGIHRLPAVRCKFCVHNYYLGSNTIWCTCTKNHVCISDGTCRLILFSLGTTQVPQASFEDFVKNLNQTKFRMPIFFSILIFRCGQVPLVWKQL